MATEYHRGDSHVYRSIAGESLLVALRREAVSPLFALTPTAVALWQRLATWATLETLAQSLVEAFEVSTDVAIADVRVFIEQLREIGAVQIRENP
jgi:hypothetical protein